ncbi:unnamed protein product [Brassica oleracea var. botrytis]|uniref:(rape) hypothetical protein n=1 Tax=Brassica napus TaxID=3708 RepID=A0A816RXW0_BRANA|nr:unnamed protein product [Brassica napus]
MRSFNTQKMVQEKHKLMNQVVFSLLKTSSSRRPEQSLEAMDAIWERSSGSEPSSSSSVFFVSANGIEAQDSLPPPLTLLRLATGEERERGVTEMRRCDETLTRSLKWKQVNLNPIISRRRNKFSEIDLWIKACSRPVTMTTNSDRW